MVRDGDAHHRSKLLVNCDQKDLPNSIVPIVQGQNKTVSVTRKSMPRNRNEDGGSQEGKSNLPAMHVVLLGRNKCFKSLYPASHLRLVSVGYIFPCS